MSPSGSTPDTLMSFTLIPVIASRLSSTVSHHQTCERKKQKPTIELATYSLYFTCSKLCGGHSWSLGPLHRDSGVGLYKMVSKFLVWRLGEHCLFPEIRGETAIVLEMASKVALAKLPRVAVQPLAEV